MDIASPPPRNPIKKHNHFFTVPIGIRPELQRTAVEIIIWGVRNMRPFKLLSVDTPLVLIHVSFERAMDSSPTFVTLCIYQCYSNQLSFSTPQLNDVDLNNHDQTMFYLK